MVFYLKYRPRKISELDSKILQDRLETVLAGKLPDKIPHAFLFTGPKGLGKTSTARILAKAINCTDRKASEFEPCNKCSQCLSIDNGSNLDILEIDGASNRGIDEIRDLREKIRLSPVSSKKKIYIIDEVHMLTTEAFNALLKTLEEPPAHAQFILCTTEPQKIPDTILSRCFNIKFSRATDEDLVHSFERILKGEEIKFDNGALLEIAKLSDGSFRDGAKILEEISIGTSSVTLDSIEKKYKFQSINKNIDELILALKNRDSKMGMKIVSDLANENTDFKIFIEQLIDKLHKTLISQVQDRSNDMSDTRDLISMLVKSHASIKYVILPQLPLELTIIDWCAKDELSDIIHSTSSGSSKSQISNKSEANEPGKMLKYPKSTSFSEAVQVQRDKIEAQDANIRVERRQEEKIVKKSTNKTNSESDNILESLIEKVKKENFSIAGVLRGCSVERFDEKSLVLSTEFAFHKEKLNDKKVIEMLEINLKEITGKDIEVKIELSA